MGQQRVLRDSGVGGTGAAGGTSWPCTGSCLGRSWRTQRTAAPQTAAPRYATRKRRLRGQRPLWGWHAAPRGGASWVERLRAGPLCGVSHGPSRPPRPQPAGRAVLTAPEGVGQAAVEPAVELLVHGPEDERAQLDEVDDQPAHHEDEADEEVHDKLGLQEGKQAHGRCSGARARSFTENSRPEDRAHGQELRRGPGARAVGGGETHGPRTGAQSHGGRGRRAHPTRAGAFLPQVTYRWPDAHVIHRCDRHGHTTPRTHHTTYTHTRIYGKKEKTRKNTPE